MKSFGLGKENLKGASTVLYKSNFCPRKILQFEVHIAKFLGTVGGETLYLFPSKSLGAF